MHYLKEAKVWSFSQTLFIQEKVLGKETHQFQKMKEIRKTTMLKIIARLKTGRDQLRKKAFYSQSDIDIHNHRQKRSLLKS